MFHKLRFLHKWIGLIACLFLVLLSVSGFFLAVKSQFDWMRPKAQQGGEIANFNDVIPVGVALDAAFAEGLDGLETPDDIDRFEYHAEDNIYKVLSKENYHEVQVDGASGAVLNVGKRNDQLTEDLHTMAYFSDFFNVFILPIIAIFLFILGVTGVIMFFTPIVRRWKFKRKQKLAQKAA